MKRKNNIGLLAVILLLAAIVGIGSIDSVSAASITVVSPNGGEIWKQGSTQQIKWTSIGIPSTKNVDIKIFQGTTQRAHWITPNDGSFPLTVTPATYPVSSNYKVQITGTDVFSNVKDTSNNNFNVIASTGSIGNAKFYSDKKTYTQIPIEMVQLTLQSIGTAPVWVKTNEPWKIINVVTGKTVNIPICMPVGYGGCGIKKLMPWDKITKSWNQKDSSENLVPPGTYVASAKYYKSDPSTGSPTAYILTTLFTIVEQPSITVVSPNGGENWKRGTTHTISWSRIGNTGTYVKIELLKGTNVNRIISSSTANDGSYSWYVPTIQTPGIDYKVRITSTNNPIYKDTSNSNFIISS